MHGAAAPCQRLASPAARHLCAAPAAAAAAAAEPAGWRPLRRSRLHAAVAWRRAWVGGCS
jgi:hypothetical protein